MDKDITVWNSAFTSILSAYGSHSKQVPMPYANDIFLINCQVAGTYYVDLSDIEPTLEEGQNLVLKREPDNKFDELAILVTTEKGEKLGYIPRVKNEIMARLMDAGKLIYAKLKYKEWQYERLYIDIDVYMKDF